MSACQKLDLTGKLVFLIITHEGGGIANALKDVRQMAPYAKVEEGLVLRGGEIDAHQDEIICWA